jgi:hypothetical protein
MTGTLAVLIPENTQLNGTQSVFLGTSFKKLPPDHLIGTLLVVWQQCCGKLSFSVNRRKWGFRKTLLKFSVSIQGDSSC